MGQLHNSIYGPRRSAFCFMPAIGAPCFGVPSFTAKARKFAEFYRLSLGQMPASKLQENQEADAYDLVMCSELGGSKRTQMNRDLRLGIPRIW